MALPMAHLMVLSLLGAVVVLLGIFLATGSYARKETVVGYLTTTGGAVHVFPAFSGGTLIALNVRQDDEVLRGDVLALVSAQRPLEGGGHLGAQLQQFLALQHRALTEERVRTRAEFRALRTGYENTLMSIQAEISSARHAQSLRGQSLELMNTRTQALQQLRYFRARLAQPAVRRLERESSRQRIRRATHPAQTPGGQRGCQSC